MGRIKRDKTPIIEILKNSLEIKNIETKLHTDRVSNYCIEMAKELGLSNDMIKKAGRVGTLHDIGKIAIADRILLKPGKLTEYEYEVMKTHSEDTSLDEVYWPCSHSRAIPSFPSQLEWKIGLAWANTRGSLNSPS